jgi:hypothetical protein
MTLFDAFRFTDPTAWTADRNVVRDLDQAI